MYQILRHNADSNVVQKAEISTERQINTLDLKASDETFNNFISFLDEKCIEGLDIVYGKFSGFTSPILSQLQLGAISDKFKATMPRNYHAISSLLNKSTKSNFTRLQKVKGQWDRDVLYTFLTILRKR